MKAKHGRPLLGKGVEEGDVDEVGFHMISDDLDETMQKLNDVRAKRPKYVLFFVIWCRLMYKP